MEFRPKSSNSNIFLGKAMRFHPFISLDCSNRFDLVTPFLYLERIHMRRFQAISSGNKVALYLYFISWLTSVFNYLKKIPRSIPCTAEDVLNYFKCRYKFYCCFAWFSAINIQIKILANELMKQGDRQQLNWIVV